MTSEVSSKATKATKSLKTMQNKDNHENTTKPIDAKNDGCDNEIEDEIENNIKNESKLQKMKLGEEADDEKNDFLGCDDDDIFPCNTENSNDVNDTNS